jgi:fatty-acyl-CoA synthase
VQHNLWTIFDAVAAAVPDREGIVWRDVRRSYAEVHDRARRLGAVLADRGLGCHTERDDLQPWERGQDTVALYLLNGPEYLEAMLGGYAARTAPFNVNYRYVADELAYLLADAGTAAVIYHGRFALLLRTVLLRLAGPPPVLLQVADDSGEPLLDGAVDYESALAAAAVPPRDRHDHRPDDLYLLYTGGTTGMPKGTLWRQADIWAAAMGGDLLGDLDLDAVVAAAVGGGNRFLPNAPFMHGAAQWIAMRQLLGGGAVVVNAVVDRLDPVEVWTTLERERCDCTLMVGEAFVRPLVTELERGRYDASSLRLVVVGGAVTSPGSKARLLHALPDAIVLDAAGASETGTGLSAVSTRGSTTEAGVFAATPHIAVLDAELQRDRRGDPRRRRGARRPVQAPQGHHPGRPHHPQPRRQGRLPLGGRHRHPAVVGAHGASASRRT